jgi:hypothetical protein
MTSMWGPGEQPDGPQPPPGPYYQSPNYPPPPPQRQPFVYTGKPGVISWFMAYCVFMAIIYVLVVLVSIWILSSPETFLEDGRHTAEEMRIQGIVMGIISIPLTILFAIGPMLPRRPWVWIYDIVLICLGMTSCCLWPATIPMLIYWIKPEARAWFGRSV